jgi:hypothetical protein
VTDPLAGLTVVVVLAVGSMLLAARLRIPAIRAAEAAED